MGNIFLVYIENAIYCKCNTCIVSKDDLGSPVETVFGNALTAHNVQNVIHSYDYSFYCFTKAHTVYLFDPDAIEEKNNKCNKIYCKTCINFIGWCFSKENASKFIVLKDKLKSI
jgi:hypothetical protein